VIGDVTGAGKKANTASTTVQKTAAAPGPSPTPSVAVSHSTAPSVPVSGGTYPNAAAVLARLAAAGLACTGASPMSGASAFYPGSTSFTACNSPGGKSQDTSAEVFDTSAHLAGYKTTLAANITEPTGIVIGVNWAVDSTNQAWARKVQQALGGQYATLTASTASATATTPAPSASQANFASLMTSLGFFPGGGPAYTIDTDGEAVCGNLQTESMSAVIAYEESVDENTLTGMTTKNDIVTLVPQLRSRVARAVDLCVGESGCAGGR
jgi:hypothetical protein